MAAPELKELGAEISRKVQKGLSQRTVEEPEPEAPASLSLHDVTLGRLDRTNRPLQPLNRLVIVGGAVSDASETADWHQDTVPTLADPGDQAGFLTGLLLQLPTGWVHCVEGPLFSISALLKALQQRCKGGSMTNVRIVACMDDIPARCFTRWGQRQLDIVRSNFTEIDASTLPAVLADTAISMLKVGRQLGSKTRDKAADHLDDWATHCRDFMVSNERVEQLLGLEELPTLDEFISTYETPSDVVLESDLVWPPPSPLCY